ncbi:hypothetical protein [Hydrocarboniphaga sp.]|uniref:hypothetical protein n=1 Tax=Hydrocarboniphaga sp. TaxID=2033016 RepID=UPI003D0E6B19
MLLRPNTEICTAEFLCGLLNCRTLIESASGLALGQTRLRISLGRLKELRIPVPPIKLQQEFSLVCTQIHSLVHRLLRHTESVEGLFSSIQKQSFCGAP